MTERPETPAGPGGRRRLILAAALLLGAAAGLAGVYGIGGGTRNAVAITGAGTAAGQANLATSQVNSQANPEASQVDDQASVTGADAACASASETGRRIADLAKGELAAFAPTLKPTRIPDLAFLGPDGEKLTLSQVGGTGLKLVNIWATWCVPCREEMPALDKLQATLGSPGAGAPPSGFSVVALNIDTRDPEKPKRFLEETGIRHLALYTDPKAKAFQELRTVGRGFGLPTTMLIDAQGCEIGHIAGPAEWASPDALALIRTALGEKAPATP